MPRLNAEQVQRLQKIRLDRDLQRLSGLLAQCFPDIPERLGERYGALIAHGVQRGAAQGLTHTLCVARYLACWFMLGAEFEGKPGHEWAREILADPRRSQGAKIFQLCRRTREALARLNPAGAPRPGQTSPAAFDQAIATLDEALVDDGLIGTLVRGGRVALGAPCDIDALDIRLVETEPPRHYAFEQGQWRLVPRPAVQTPVTLSAVAPPAPPVAAGAPAPAPRPTTLPAALTVLGREPGARPTRLRLRTLAANCCDPHLHPLVTFNGPLGVAEWRGPQAADIALDLYAGSADPTPPEALQPTLAAEGPRQVGMLTLSSCGVRESGPSLGTQATRVDVLPAEQHLMAWRREPGPELSWPEPPGGHPAAPPSRCRIERDGVALDAARWQAGLDEIDRQLAQGLGRLYTAWGRESGVLQPRMVAEPSVLCGDAGLSWGWSDGPQGIVSPAFFRIAGRLELIACQLNLRFSGEVAWRGAISRLSLQSHGRALLHPVWQRGPTDAEMLPPLVPTQAKFHHPFVLQLEAVAQAETAVLDSGPVSGALVGSCGLRPRGDGQGLEWFAQLAIEPVMATLHWIDPLLGSEDLPRTLLPALNLLDWRLG